MSLLYSRYEQEIKACTTYEWNEGTLTVSCIRGLWVASKDKTVDTLNSVEAYFSKYKREGAYDDILSKLTNYDELIEEGT